MSFTLCVPVFASESEGLEIQVNDEQDILEFIFSNEFNPHAAYRFVYPDSTVMSRASLFSVPNTPLHRILFG